MPATDAPTTEIGHVSTWADPRFGGWPIDETEDAAAWTWPESLRTADRMARHPMIASVWWALTLPLRGDIWALDPQDARPEVVDQLSEDLDLPVMEDNGRRRPRRPMRRRGRFSWPEHVRLCLLHLRYGHMPFEVVFSAEALEQAGQARLRKLAPRFPRTIAEINVERDGGLRSIRQWATTGNARPDPIPVERLVWYANDREGANWQGRSILRSASWAFNIADRLERVEAMTGERNGMGIPWVESPTGATQPQVDAAAEVAMRYRAGEYSGLSMPPGFKLHLAGVEGTLPILDPTIKRWHGLMAKSVQQEFRELGSTDSGNRALGETLADGWVLALDAVAGGMADVATQHIVEDIVDLNWGETEAAPAVVALPIDAERDIPVEAIVRLREAGAVEWTDEDEAWLRARYRMPRRDMDAPRPAPPAPISPQLDVAASVGDVVRREIADAFAARAQVVAASAPPTRAEDDVLARVAAALSDVVSRPTEAPQVTVAAAPPANVTVEAPPAPPAPNVVVQAAPPPNVVVQAAPAPSVTVNMPPRTRRIERDAQGNITRIIDEE